MTVGDSPTRIARIALRDVGPFRDVSLELPPGSDPTRADVYLLTGQNGTGKSTILYALAAAIQCGHSGLGGEKPLPMHQHSIARRFRTPTATIAIDMGRFRRVVAWKRLDGVPRESITDPIGGSDLRRYLIPGDLAYYGNEHDVHRYDEAVKAVDVERPLSWAAFAYAGKRSIQRGTIEAIVEPRTPPFENSLSFDQSTDSGLLAYWIASQQFKHLKARMAGDEIRAARFQRSITDIARIVGELVDDPTFEFDTGTVDDNDVRVRYRGEKVDLDLLPDGLKSIVSWIADLLMRLDRTPWVDDLPVLERPFLLLLDEIDIHLHPAWQRKVLPVVQRMFPNAQIIASTHSPFVVASATDAHIISLAMKGAEAVVESVVPGHLGISYSAVLRSIFGIDSEFDVDTEAKFDEFRAARDRLLRGESTDRAPVNELARQLSERSEEVAQLIGYELRQLDRLLAQRATG